eukprot:TRINITY_DN28181_c1_g1_i1.p1 TRINITY_DN28181_c1_g1~~TRINITY_DN28181_c1_g1_i1.p1  ORF type:complete len:525 (+),score=169.76 TRINITY_DN28181_c1_g1_i1:76-1650(+)
MNTMTNARFSRYVDNLHDALFGKEGLADGVSCVPAGYDTASQTHILLACKQGAVPDGFLQCASFAECQRNNHVAEPAGVACYAGHGDLGWFNSVPLRTAPPMAVSHTPASNSRGKALPRTAGGSSGQISATQASPKHTPDDPDRIFSLVKGSGSGGLGVVLDGTLIVGVEAEGSFRDAGVPSDAYILMVNSMIVCREDEIYEEIERSQRDVFTIKIRHRLKGDQLPGAASSSSSGKGSKKGRAGKGGKGAKKTVLDTPLAPRTTPMRVESFKTAMQYDEKVAKAAGLKKGAKKGVTKSGSKKPAPKRGGGGKQPIGTKAGAKRKSRGDSDDDSSSSSSSSSEKPAAKKGKKGPFVELLQSAVDQAISNIPYKNRTQAVNEVREMWRAPSVTAFDPRQFVSFAKTYYVNPGPRHAMKLTMRNSLPAFKDAQSKEYFEVVETILMPEKFRNGKTSLTSRTNATECELLLKKNISDLLAKPFKELPPALGAYILAMCKSKPFFIKASQKVLPHLFEGGDLLLLATSK